jgi:predicted nucleic acid-binding protein
MPGLGLSAQVMQEYFHVAYRKARLGITRDEAMQTLRLLARKPVAPIDASLVIEAAGLSDRFQISYWDAAIVAASLALSCETIYSEDLNHGQVYHRVRVINLFVPE